MPTFIATNGEDFLVQQQDRAYKGALTEALKVNGQTGGVTVAGQTISSSGVIGSTGAVTATTVHATGAVTADTTLAVTGNTALTGTLIVSGATTLPAATTIGTKTPMTGSLYSAIIAGANASGGTVSTTLAGAVITDKVVAVIDLNNNADVQADFETAVTVTGHIQQTAANLAAVTTILVILQHL